MLSNLPKITELQVADGRVQLSDARVIMNKVGIIRKSKGKLNYQRA